MPKKNQPLNLEDIAERAGVSRSTVSRVINNEPYVSQKTRMKVEQVIEEVGFTPNPVARMLVTQKTRIIGVVIPHTLDDVFDDPFYFPTLLQGVAETTNANDYGMLLWLGQSDEDEARFHRRVLQNRLMDGLILVSIRVNDPWIEQLLESDIPFTMVERPRQFEEHVSYVGLDNVQAAQMAVKHLIGLGYQRIGTITGALDNYDALDRLDGYKIALENAGRDVDETLIADGDFRYQSGYDAMQYLLSQGVDAVFAASDRMAMGALQALHEADLRVPDDVALVGFDDLPSALRSKPPLTTIHQPIRQKGARAAEILLNLIEGEITAPQQVILPTKLVVRQSCGGAD